MNILSSYRIKILISYFIIIVVAFLLVINLFNVSNTSDVGEISEGNMKNKFFEREKHFKNYFSPYFASIKALQSSKLFEDYLDGKVELEVIKNYFLTIQKSLPNLRQVRYIDNSGQEIIRVDGIINKKSGVLIKESYIVPKNKLQNKKDRYYFKDFIILPKEEVGISKLDLNIENGTISIPKQAMTRLGISVYDSLNNKKGILIFNICLKSLFKDINETILYNVHIIDDKGRFLNHHNSKYGITGENSDYDLFDEFPSDAENILRNRSFFTYGLYSQEIEGFKNGQNLKILIKIKYLDEIKHKKKTQETFFWILMLLSIVSLPIVIYFSKLPDLIKKSADKERLLNKLTGLPNRLALVEDLTNRVFPNSTVVILVYINNLMKIQSTYGYQISDELVKKFASEITNYKSENILKVYSNNYSTFTINYDYADYGSFKNFIENLASDIESCTFKVNNEEFDFLLDITLGVSNPHKLNYGVEELNEGENALELALSRKENYNIFDASHNDTIKSNKENILLAKRIKDAIENDGVKIFFQPIYNNFKKEVDKFECLARLEINDEIIYPNEFLPISKEINKYNTITSIMIDKAFEYFKDKNCDFSINLSVLDISNISLREHLFEKIKEYDFKDRFIIEIVEQEGVQNFNEFTEFLKKVKEYNVKVAIDDFGSGYSNFEYIINMSNYIDYLKIDGSLIKNISKNRKIQLLVGILKFLCDNLNIKVIAEFIEDEETFDFVKSMGISYSQGYYIGKPRNCTDIEDE